METSLKKREPQKSNLLKSFKNISQNNKGEVFISKYTGEIISDECIIKQIMRVRTAFPNKPEFFDLLFERINAKKEYFTDQRLIDAVDNLIDNFTYQQPTIADIVSFDKKEKLLSRDELLDLVSENKNAWDNYNFAVEVDGKRYYSKIKQNV